MANLLFDDALMGRVLPRGQRWMDTADLDEARSDPGMDRFSYLAWERGEDDAEESDEDAWDYNLWLRDQRPLDWEYQPEVWVNGQRLEDFLLDDGEFYALPYAEYVAAVRERTLDRIRLWDWEDNGPQLDDLVVSVDGLSVQEYLAQPLTLEDFERDRIEFAVRAVLEGIQPAELADGHADRRDAHEAWLIRRLHDDLGWGNTRQGRRPDSRMRWKTRSWERSANVKAATRAMRAGREVM